MSILPYNTPHSLTYYTPPRAAHYGRLLAALVVAALVGVAIAVFYVRALQRIDYAPIRTAATVAAALAVAGTAILVCRFGRVTTPGPAAVASSLLALLVLYAAWVAWVAWVRAVLEMLGAFVPADMLALRPDVIVRTIIAIGQEGVWSYNDRTVRGLPLYAVWVIEAGLLTIVPVYLAIHMVGGANLFCRTCTATLTSVRGMPRLAADREDEVKQAVEAGDYDALLSQDPLADDDDPQIDFDLQECPRCRGTYVLSVSQSAWVVQRDGTARVEYRPLIKRLMITPEQAAQIKQLRERLEAEWARRFPAEDAALDRDNADGEAPPPQ